MNKVSNFSLTKKLKNISILGSLLFLVAVSCVSTANAYNLQGFKWPQPSSTFYVDIPGENGLWHDAFEGAMYEWGMNTVFQYYIVSGTYSDPCNAYDYKNGVRFDSTDCGDSWGSATLAVTHTWYIGTTIVETDIVFNSNEPWDVYFGPLSYYSMDFRRVAVHELGHALGLDHEDSGVSTIMGTYVGNTTIPQQDDINGVAAMYDYIPYIPCTYSLSPTSKSVLSGGISSSVYVTTPSNCNWTASESLNWVAITSGSSSAGSGSVYYTVAPNTTNIQRSGTIMVAGKSFTISQAAAPLITYYRDYDSDGYGNPNDSLTTSSKPTGYVSDNTDCDDTNANIHPGATEIAGDGIDQDCDGVDKTSGGNLIIINPDLSFSIPDALYQSLAGDFNLWLDFEFFGDQSGKLLWELAASGIATPTGNYINISPTLSFSISDAKMQSLTGDINLEINFKFFGDQSGKLLWELESFTVK